MQIRIRAATLLPNNWIRVRSDLEEPFAWSDKDTELPFQIRPFRLKIPPKSD
jgi:hypothetical protein